MEQTKTRRPEHSETEVARVFEELGLEAQEQRDDVLQREVVKKPAEQNKVRYITRLSNSTTPAPTA